MASIYKRKDTENKKGKLSWRAVIRIKGYPTVSKTSDRKQELIDWAQETERQIKSGLFNFDHYKNQHTFDELVDRYIQDGILEHHRSAADTKRHLIYWKSRLGAYAVVHINTALLSKERQYLSETPTSKGSKRTTATTNRYMSSLSSLLSYAASHLNWLKENPALRLKKLKRKPRTRSRPIRRRNHTPSVRCQREQVPLSLLHYFALPHNRGEARRAAWTRVEGYRLRKRDCLHPRIKKRSSSQHRFM